MFPGSKTPAGRFSRAPIAVAALALATGCLGTGPGITPVQTAFNRGVYQHDAGHYEDAIDEYEEALDDNPDDYRARFNMAMSYEALAAERAAAGDATGAARARDEARSLYETVLEQRPDNERAAINLAAMLYEAGRVDDAKARLQAIIDSGARSTLPYCALAAHLLHEGKAARAIALLERARDLAPADPQVNLLLGDARFRHGDVPGAREAYRAALEHDKEHIGTLLALARLEFDAGNHDEAETLLRRALLLDPWLAPAHLLMARIVEDDDPQAAVQHLWAVREASETEPEGLRDRLIRLYRRLIEIERDPGGS